MAKRPPKRIALKHDDFSAKYVGYTADGRQFFLTTPFVPASDQHPGREFLALYQFDAKGRLLEARVEDLGTRAALDAEQVWAAHGRLLASLGPVTFGPIEVAPFCVERFGVEFGLIPLRPEEPGEDWSVIVEPGNYMAFFPPWDSGDYDT